MSEFSIPQTYLDDITHALNTQRSGRPLNPAETVFLCPAHDDHSPSANWNSVKGAWHCHACDEGGGAFDLGDFLGIPRPERQTSSETAQIVYGYQDADGKELFQVVRTMKNGKKTFSQRQYNPTHPKAKADGWAWTLEGIQRVAYRLPELLEAVQQDQPVFIVEGEKDVATLEGWGHVATCNAGGAGKWRDEYSEILRGADVVIIPDNDKAGRDHCTQVAKSLEGKAKTIRVLDLPDLPEKSDVTDWKAQGGTLEQFEALLENAPSAVVWLGSMTSPKNTDEEGEESESKKKPASTRLLEYVKEAGAELWHDENEQAYMSIPLEGGGRATYRLPSAKAREWLETLFYRKECRAISAQAVQESLGILKGQARLEGGVYPVGVRVLAYDGRVYLDLGDPTWNVVEINKGGWLIRSALEVPVRFWRPNGLKPLPAPTKGQSLLELRRFLNTDERGFVLATAWLTAALAARAPYPILALNGEQGTGKSTASRVCRELLDPNTAGLRSAPKGERDLFISAKNSAIMAFDNLSFITPELADSMCRLATGGGFSTRTLYENDEEALFNAARPLIVNGIPELTVRPDLADRTIGITLERIDETERMDEATFWEEFNAARAGILGALCEAVSTYLRNWENTRLEVKPRMADFARLVVAAEPALPWAAGDFLGHYQAAREELAISTLEGDLVAAGVKVVLDSMNGGEWRGTADELFDELRKVLNLERLPKNYPQNARALSEKLTRIAPSLRQTGIIFEKIKSNGRKVVIVRPLRPYLGGKNQNLPSDKAKEAGSHFSGTGSHSPKTGSHSPKAGSHLPTVGMPNFAGTGSQGSHLDPTGSHVFEGATLPKTPPQTEFIEKKEPKGSQGSQTLPTSLVVSNDLPEKSGETLSPEPALLTPSHPTFQIGTSKPNTAGEI